MCVLLLCAEQREGGVGNPRLVSLGMRQSNLDLAGWFIGVMAQKTPCGLVPGVHQGSLLALRCPLLVLQVVQHPPMIAPSSG